MKNKESVFSRLFSYRQRECLSPLENYLTELFSYCLDNDLDFRNNFLENCLNIKVSSDNFNIETQIYYDSLGRPDIEITFDETIIIIECKVDSLEKDNQLNDYLKILNNHHSDKKNKHLVFLTKFHEDRKIEDLSIKFHLIRWFSICDLIKNSNTEITYELKKFLIDKGMERIKNFTIQDILAMKTISETMTKMDEVLDYFKDQFKREFIGYSKESSRSSRLAENRYTNYATLKFNGDEYYLHIGFFWWWEEFEIPYIGVLIQLPLKKFKNSLLIQNLNDDLVVQNEWEIEEDENGFYISSLLPITDFVLGSNGISEMQTFIQDQLNILYDLKNKGTGLLTK